MRRLALAFTVLLIGAAPARAADDLTLVDSQKLDARLTDLTFKTSALPTEPHVRVLLPANYSPKKRYPVLYLLHGGAGSSPDWTTQGNAEPATAKLPLIVVMPEAGQGGWYTNWANPGTKGQPRWETFHIDELLPWIDAHFRTNGERAIAGLSMGGFGAFSYAARHPDLFEAAASFSGAIDTNTPDPEAASATIDGIASLDGGLPGSLFGLRATHDIDWRGHNPWDLAVNLRPLSLTIRTGNGQTGGPYGGGGDPLEPAVHLMSVSMHERLDTLKIAHVWDDYGPGGHAWPYWNRDLTETLPSIMKALDAGARPKRVTYTSIDPSFGAYGWRVALDRHTAAFATLSDAARNGFKVTGSGAGTVTTPPVFKPRAVYLVDSRRTRADAGGRLRTSIDLGTSGTKTVGISRVRR